MREQRANKPAGLTKHETFAGIRVMARSLARSPKPGLSPMLQRLSSMWREISHETVDAVRRCAPYSDGSSVAQSEYFGEHAAEAPCGSARFGSGWPGDQRIAVGADASWE
jgi:hypothetical protein